jgi:hypothetical protein
MLFWTAFKGFDRSVLFWNWHYFDLQQGNPFSINYKLPPEILPFISTSLFTPSPSEYGNIWAVRRRADGKRRFMSRAFFRIMYCTQWTCCVNALSISTSIYRVVPEERIVFLLGCNIVHWEKRILYETVSYSGWLPVGFLKIYCETQIIFRFV